MRVALVLNRDDVLLPSTVDEFLKSTKHSVVAIYAFPLLPPRAKKWPYTKAVVRLSGPEYLLRSTLSSLGRRIFSVLPIPAAAAWKRLSSLRRVSQAHGVPYIEMSSVNSREFIDSLKVHGVELVFNICSQIYDGTTLRGSGVRFCNFHPSLLPRNKGLFPIFWAFMRDGGEQGVTCHEIDEKIDHGRIVLQTTIPCSTADTFVSVFERVLQEAPRIIEEALDRIQRNEYMESPIRRESFYGPIPNRSQIQAYRRVLRERRCG